MKQVSKVVAGDILNTQDLDDCGTEKVVRVTLVNQKFNSSLSTAIERLTEVKRQIDKFSFTPDCTVLQYSKSQLGSKDEKRFSDQLTILVNDISIAMEKLSYASYRRNVYKKDCEVIFTYCYKCEARAFINTLATNEFFKSRLIWQMRNVVNLLEDPHCELFQPLKINYDMVEVNNGICWSIKNRSFVL